MKGIWKHLFFIERVLALIGTRVFGSVDEFKEAVKSSPMAWKDDAQMIDDSMKPPLK